MTKKKQAVVFSVVFTNSVAVAKELDLLESVLPEIVQQVIQEEELEPTE